MESFDELGLSPDVVEALVAEGIERPTELQSEAIPVLRRGNPALVRGGPGAGVLATYGPVLLDRIEPVPGPPAAIVVLSDEADSVRKARALARTARLTGHRVAALSGGFALPGHADLLFGTPAQFEGALAGGGLDVGQVGCWVLDGAESLLSPDGSAEPLQRLLDALPAEAQGVVLADPVTARVREFADTRLPRAVHVPSDAAVPVRDESPVRRGTLRLVAEDGEQGLIDAVAETLESGEVHHVLLFLRGEDRAADAGDLLALHGYPAGAPGDPDTPVWLAIDPLSARRAISDSGPRVVISVGAPSDADELDRRHGQSGGGVVVLPARQLPHLRRVAAQAGYGLEGAERLVQATDADSASAAAPAPTDDDSDRRPEPFQRLFLSIGSRDGVGPGDLLGAITGEAEVPGDRVGRIDIRETFSRVDVGQGVADRVIEALNGITIRGRSVRADYDRAADRARDSEKRR